MLKTRLAFDAVSRVRHELKASNFNFDAARFAESKDIFFNSAQGGFHLIEEAFFIIGLLIWAVREWKPKQREAVEFKIMSISHGEQGGHH